MNWTVEYLPEAGGGEWAGGVVGRRPLGGDGGFDFIYSLDTAGICTPLRNMLLIVNAHCFISATIMKPVL